MSYIVGSEPKSHSQVYFETGAVATNRSLASHDSDWRSFLKKYINAEIVPTFEGREACFQYYKAATDKLGTVAKESSEHELTQACLHPLVNFGNVVMEDCSNQISDFSRVLNGKYASDPRGRAFRSSCFVREPENISDRVDIVGRLPTPIDVGNNPGNIVIRNIGGQVHRFTVSVAGELERLHHDPPVDGPLPEIPEPAYRGLAALSYPLDVEPLPYLQHPLPPYRVSPLQTVWVHELKALRVNLLGENLKHVHQTSFYLESLLRTTPNREVAFGVLTNLKSCVFVAVHSITTRKGGLRSFQSYHSKLIVNTNENKYNVATNLADFVSTDCRAHGYPENLRFTMQFTPIQFLGRGSTGMVMSGIFGGDEVVMKISVHARALQFERWILRYLRRRNIPQNNIPELHEEAQRALSDDMLHSCTLFRRRYVRNSLTRADLMVVWQHLCALHEVGIVHRDVRSANIMLNQETGSAILIDYSAACTFRLPDDAATADMNATILELTHLENIEKFASYFEPRCVVTSSDAVLDGAQTLPADEACSLIYVAFSLRFPNGFFSNCGVDADFVYTRSRSMFADSEHHEQGHEDIIFGVLANLKDEREDCSVQRRTDLLNEALDAVYSL